jgi:hypothetical protein
MPVVLRRASYALRHHGGELLHAHHDADWQDELRRRDHAENDGQAGARRRASQMAPMFNVEH